jgi:hypothetical protein
MRWPRAVVSLGSNRRETPPAHTADIVLTSHASPETRHASVPRQAPAPARHSNARNPVADLQRTIGNQATRRLIEAIRSRVPVQRAFTTMPLAYANAVPGQEQARFLDYINSRIPVATNNLVFNEETRRIRDKLGALQPNEAADIVTQQNNLLSQLKMKDNTAGVANATLLDGFVTGLNALVNTYQLDAPNQMATGSVAASGRENHPAYSFQLPGDQAPQQFDLDAWSRRANADFLGGQFSGQVVKNIVEAAIDEWQPANGGIVSLLNLRLFGAESPLARNNNNITIPAVFWNTPVGRNYTRILVAASHAITTRAGHLPVRPAQVTRSYKANVKPDEKFTVLVDWNAHLATMRAQLKAIMKTENASETRLKDLLLSTLVPEIAADAAEQTDGLKRLRQLNLLKVKADQGTISLASGAVRAGSVTYAVTSDDLPFDLNHLKGLLFIEWKAVSDVLRQA